LATIHAHQPSNKVEERRRKKDVSKQATNKARAYILLELKKCWLLLMQVDTVCIIVAECLQSAGILLIIIILSGRMRSKCPAPASQPASHDANIMVVPA